MAQNGTRASEDPNFDVVVVGAGFAGIYALHRLRGLGLRVRVFEAGDGVGGTWFWNRYPGARCDVESMEYSYQFSDELQQEWEWTERYASQAEILRYIEHVVDRFDLARDIRLETRVESAVFDEASSRWTVRTSRGETVTARFCILATGCLSEPKAPDIEGVDSFAGLSLFTARWPKEGVDLGGKRVGVIGTGSTGIQSIPVLAEQAAHLTVFQRTPNFSIPARNRPLDPAEQRRIKRGYADLRARAAATAVGFDVRPKGKLAYEVDEDERTAEYEDRWMRGGAAFLGAFDDLLFDHEANETAAEFVREKIHEIVADPGVAEALSPRHAVGCKRLCLDTHYYETFNRPNVTLVDLRRNPIERITRRGVRTRDGDVELDAIVYATGFDAMTGALLAIDVRGRGGITIQEKWAEGARNYLGLSIAGFPNLFVVAGPGSPSVLSNMVPSIEQHVNWITRLVDWMRAQGRDTVEASAASEDAWVARIAAIAERTVYPSCNSWYVGANIPGKPRVFSVYLGFAEYVQRCEEIAAAGYEGFVFESSPGIASGARGASGATSPA